MKESFEAPNCCVDCKVDTPEKFYGCESPCDKYRKEYAARAEAKMKVEAEHLRTN